MGSNEIQLVVTAKDEASKKIQGISKSVSGLSSAFSLIGKSVAIAGGAVATAGAFAMKSASDFEQSAMAFESLLGSAEKAKVLLKSVSDFAKETPFELPEVVEGSKRLLAYGLSMEDVIPKFKMLGDMAAGVGKEKLPQLITAFGQVQAKGKLMGQELLQFTEAGINLGGALQEQLGVGRGALEKMISKGQVGAEEVTKALEAMTSEGGLFFNGMEKQATTFSGVMSNVSDSIGKVARELIGINDQGEIREGSIFFHLKKGAEALKSFLESNEGAIISGFINISNAIGSGFQNAVQAVRDFFSETNVVWQFIVTLFGPSVLTIIGSIQNAWERVREALEPIMPQLEMLAKFFGVIIVGALAVLLAVIAKIVEAVAQFITGLVEMFASLVEGMTAGFEAFFLLIMGQNDLAIESFKKAWESFKTFMKGLWTAISSAGVSMLKPILNILNSMISGYNKIAGKVGWKKLSEIKSFSEERELGGSVTAGVPYLVGEKRPEVFVPSQSGNIRQLDQAGSRDISVTFNNVSVRNDNDLQYIVSEVRKVLGREQELSRIGAY